MRYPGDTGVTGAIKRPKQGTQLKKAYSAAQIRSLLYELKLFLMEGRRDEEIQTLMNANGNVGVGRYNELKRELYRQEQAALNNATAEDVYLEYKWAQERCLQDLDSAMGQIPENQPNALIGAIRAKSEIHDKIIKMGQDIGVISKEPERKVVIHGHLVAQLDNNALRKLIAQETNSLADALTKYGDVDMDGNPISDNKPTFSDQGKTGMQIAGPSKALAARKSRLVSKRAKVIDVDPG